jgi:hypothetical protein
MMTIQGMRAALSSQRRAEESIFYFCVAWHWGKGTDLYTALRACEFTPLFHKTRQINGDPELTYGHNILSDLYQREYGHLPVEWRLYDFRIQSVEEADVITHTTPATFPCIAAGWPCRVFKHHGGFGVPCADSKKETAFHPLETIAPDSDIVKGFLR